MMAYYNEFDPFAAAWLRNLIDAELIPFGVVDERDIRDVEPSDITGFTQCHFFAGIGGWPYALRLAGWSDDDPVWTGSPPCQPFSTAGRQLGKHDERHLTPHFLELVRAVRPPVLFGEQVAAAVTKDHWLDDLLDELEDQGYATGAAVLPACSVGAPHLRQRLFFMGYRELQRLQRSNHTRSVQAVGEARTELAGNGTDDHMADTGCGGRKVEIFDSRISRAPNNEWKTDRVRSSISVDQLAHNNNKRLEGRQPVSERPNQQSPWENCLVVGGTDGKLRPIEPGTFPLANGVPNRVGKLRGYGNAIVPQVAAEVIRVLMDKKNPAEAG